MPGLQPPGIPVFYPGFDTVTQFNTGIFTAGGGSGGIRDALTFMNHKPLFKARRAAAQTVTENVFNTIVFDTIDLDNYAGGAAGSSIYTIQAPGWYRAIGRTSLSASAAGATGLVVLPALAVNGTSPTGIGSSGWEGPVVPVPTGAGAPKSAVGVWIFYGDFGDQVQLNMWYSTESTITATDSTAGWQPSLALSWSSR